MYSGEYDACDVTLSVYPHRASMKICLSTVGIEPTTFEILAGTSMWYFGTESSSFDINVMLVMLLWVYIHAGQAWKICLFKSRSWSNKIACYNVTDSMKFHVLVLDNKKQMLIVFFHYITSSASLISFKQYLKLSNFCLGLHETRISIAQNTSHFIESRASGTI
jgi:hypothetical protein